eukprot:scaffold64_cov338-Pavlova_lutheri.AAC.14
MPRPNFATNGSASIRWEDHSCLAKRVSPITVRSSRTDTGVEAAPFPREIRDDASGCKGTHRDRGLLTMRDY